METSVALDAALSGDRVPLAGLIRIDFNDGRTLRLIDGAGSLVWGGDTYSGRDDVFGALESVDMIDDGTGDEAPAFAMTMFPANATAAADLTAPDMQGSRVRVWIGAYVRTTGAVVADPYPLFDGELDVSTLEIEANSRSVTYDCVSGFERFFANEEGMRLNPTFHQSVWPGEAGLNYVTGILDQKYWGMNPPNSVQRGPGDVIKAAF